MQKPTENICSLQRNVLQSRRCDLWGHIHSQHLASPLQGRSMVTFTSPKPYSLNSQYPELKNIAIWKLSIFAVYGFVLFSIFLIYFLSVCGFFFFFFPWSSWALISPNCPPWESLRQMLFCFVFLQCKLFSVC